MTLSPAAQAVLDAYWKSPWDPSLQHEDRCAIAAVLRAAADQVVPANGSRKNNEIRAELLAIADELERRGDKGLDLDPGETADWLRSEANPTSEENFND